MKIYLFSIGFCLVLSGFAAVVNAQDLNLNKGDEYRITTVMSSSSAMKRGDKTLEMQSMSKLIKTYKVTEVTANGYNLAMSVTNVADTINAVGQKLAYNSNRAADPASAIETALSKMVGASTTLNLDKSGKVTQVDNIAKTKSNAEAASSAGVYYDNPTVGNILVLGANFKLPAGFAKGSTWKESTKVGDATVKTTYNVEETTATETKVAYMSEITQTGNNTNVSGALVLDNKSGIVVQRILKTDSKSNLSLDGKNFITAEKRIISEICEKVK